MRQSYSQLKAGEPIELPIYDFKTHTPKTNASGRIQPIVIVEGILLC